MEKAIVMLERLDPLYEPAHHQVEPCEPVLDELLDPPYETAQL
jgi:hypothetical protein